MRLALVTAVLVACMASAEAHPPLPATATATTATSTRTKLQPGTEAVKVKTKHVTPSARGLPQNQPRNSPAPVADDPGWRAYGTLLATLALMGVIALRRQRSERS